MPCEPEQGPAVLGEAPEVLQIDLLSLGVLFRLEQCDAERLANRIVPVRRFEVESRVLDLSRLRSGCALVLIALPSGDLAGQRVRGNREPVLPSAPLGVAALISFTASSALCASADFPFAA